LIATFWLSKAKNGHKTAKTGRPGRRANPAANLDRLIETLMEPVGEEVRRQAAEAVRHADRRLAAHQPSA
jgi:hypothetical protein